MHILENSQDSDRGETVSLLAQCGVTLTSLVAVVTDKTLCWRSIFHVLHLIMVDGNAS